MLSIAKTKYIISLQQKKQRIQEEVFVVEGEKIMSELLSQDKFKVLSIYATEDWSNKNHALTSKYKGIITTISPIELKKISSLQTPNAVLALVALPNESISTQNTQKSFNLVLENIQDPGNMGTIIRIADWFGISTIFCSKGCVDIYNPKVLQATMGSFLRVQVHYTDLPQLFQNHPQLPVYGAILEGENLFQTSLKTPSFLLIGNEGQGLSQELQKFVTQGITIPKFGQAESLNAAVATGILCARFVGGK